MKLFISVVSLLLIAFCSYYFLSKYHSAFEADQACHAEKWNLYKEDSRFDCDHDLETDQWILFEIVPNHMPAKVVKRFRY